MATRPRAWVDFIGGFSQGPSNQVINLLAAATINLDTITATRIILDLYATPDSVSSTTSGIQKIEIGIGVVTEAAFDAGATAVPDPRVPADAPARGWLWRGVMVVGYQNVAGAENTNWNFPGHVAADLGAMRRVDRGRLVLISSKTALQGSEVTMDVSGIVRVLCLT